MTRKNQIKFYNRAPDLELEDMQGQPVRLSSLWQQHPALLAFTRHFGCPQCKQMLAELVEGQERIKQAGLNLAVVLQGSAAESAIFAAEFAPGLLCLADPRREAYRAFGLERGDLFQTFLNPQVWKATRAAQDKGFKVQKPPEGQDAMQMSGVFIVATDGRVVLPYYYDHIADHPSLDLLLSGVFSTRWDRDFNGPLGGDIQE